MFTLAKYLFSISLFLLSYATWAQREADWWYFGNYAGIHFTNGSPQGVTDGKISQTGGEAAISDRRGKLLFYTDGTTVYNKLHATMQGGSGLNGDPYSTQTAIIVPKPCDTNIYYIFTLDNALSGGSGVCYSEVDMTKDNGRGKVTSKNKFLFGSNTDKIAAVKHANNRDYWVLAHPNSKDTFYAYLVTPAGVTTTPVRTRAGMTHTSAGGQMKFSADGKRVAVCINEFNSSPLEVLSFDNKTGKPSAPMLLENSGEYIYGVEFSPNCRFLYATNGYTSPGVYQYDLSSGNLTTIKASKKKLGTDQFMFGSLQTGPDGKIYIARYFNDSLGAIVNPDSVYPKAAYKSNAVSLKTRNCYMGLPSFVQSFFRTPTFNAIDTCIFDTASFSLIDTITVDSLIWSFGNPASGANDTSTSYFPRHKFTASGVYQVKVQTWVGCKHDSILRTVRIDSVPVFSLGNDTFICGATPVTINAPPNMLAYSWSTGDTLSSLTVNSVGIYWCEITSSCGTYRDSIKVTSLSYPVKPNLGNDTFYCTNFSKTLNAGNPGLHYQWSTSPVDTLQHLTVNKPGVYSVKVYSGCGAVYDTMEIYISTAQGGSFLGGDTYFCGNSSVTLKAPGGKTSYRWSTSAADTFITVTVSDTGNYWVKVTDICGIARDTIHVKRYNIPQADIGNDTVICEGDSLQLSSKAGEGSYAWTTGLASDTLNTVKVTQPGTYSLKVYNVCYASYDTVEISGFNSITPILGNDTLFCGNFTCPLNVYNQFATYLWSTGDTTPAVTITNPGIYSVTLSNQCGSKTDSIEIIQRLMPQPMLGNDTFFCGQVSYVLDANVSDGSFTWSTSPNDTLQTIYIDQPGEYSVTVYNECYSASDTIEVSLIPMLQPFSLGNDTVYCQSFSRTFNVAQPGFNYLWSDGSMDSMLTVNQPGSYGLKIYNVCDVFKDTISLVIKQPPVISLGHDTILCGSVHYKLNGNFPGSYYSWSTGSILSNITADTPGIYWCKTYNECGRDSDTISIALLQKPKVDLGVDTIYCGQVLRVMYSDLAASSVWSTGDTVSTITAKQPGTYWVQAKNQCGFDNDTIEILKIGVPNFSLGPDTFYCGPFTRLLDAYDSGCVFRWASGESTSSIDVNLPGTYKVMVRNMCFTVTDSVLISQYKPAVPSLGPDTTFCKDFIYKLNAGNKGYHYLWNTGDTTQFITVSDSGLYIVNVKNQCGNIPDSIYVKRIYRPEFSIGNDTSLCQGTQLELAADTSVRYTYLWNTGETTSSIMADTGGFYQVVVQVDQRCSFDYGMTLRYFELDLLNLGNNRKLCTETNDAITLKPHHYVSYSWFPSGDTANSLVIRQTGKYSVTVVDTNQCVQTDGIEVTELCPAHIWIPNAFTPGGNDTLNNYFIPTTMFVDSFILWVYNRLGEVVYEGKQDKPGWDGTFHGKPCPPDVYTWLIAVYGRDALDTLVTVEYRKGTLQLLRR